MLISMLLWYALSELNNGIPCWIYTIINLHAWKKVVCNEWCLQGKVRLLPAVTSGKSENELI